MQSGPEQLKAWVERQGVSQNQAARQMDFNETTFCKIIKGRRRPGRTNAIRIERETGIPVEAWDVPSRIGKSRKANTGRSRKPN